jgi:hypothetical protein
MSEEKKKFNPWAIRATPVQRDSWAANIASKLKPDPQFTLPQSTLGHVTEQAPAIDCLEYECLKCKAHVKVPNSRWAQDSNRKELERREGLCLDCRFKRGLV